MDTKSTEKVLTITYDNIQKKTMNNFNVLCALFLLLLKKKSNFIKMLHDILEPSLLLPKQTLFRQQFYKSLIFLKINMFFIEL